jgi:hypothetical protein
MAKRKVWRIPVLVNSKGDIIKIWKPRSWAIDPENNYDEAEIAMSLFNERKIKIGVLTSGLPPIKNIRLVIRKDDGKTKKDVFKMYDILLQSPTILAKGREEEFDAFLKIVKDKM